MTDIEGFAVFAGVVFTITGAFYLAGAVHDTRYGLDKPFRLPEMVTTILMSAAALTVVFSVGFEQQPASWLAGLALGVGIALGLQLLLPIPALYRTPLNRILNITNVVVGFLAAIPFNIILNLMTLVGFPVIFALWGVLWLLSLPFLAVISLIARRRTTLDEVVLKALGTPIEKSLYSLLSSAALPRSPTIQWLYYGLISASSYIYMLAFGYGTTLVAKRVISPTLLPRTDIPFTAVLIFVIGIPVGYVFGAVARLNQLVGLHSKSDISVKPIMADIAPFTEGVSQALEGDRPVSEGLAQLGQMYREGTQELSRSVTDAQVPSGAVDPQTIAEHNRVRNAFARAQVSSVGSLTVGLVSALPIAFVVGHGTFSSFNAGQIGVALALAYGIDLVVGRMNALRAGISGATLWAGGTILQLIPFLILLVGVGTTGQPAQSATATSQPTSAPAPTATLTPICNQGHAPITTAGRFTIYTVLDQSVSSPLLMDMTIGPDGNVWFTDFGENCIGRLAPDGRLTEFRIPTPGAYPRGITSGPDGALWFTLGAGNGAVGRITTSGQITEYPLPTHNGPNTLGGFNTGGAITAGPDGALWFAEYDADKIGRITTGGQITEFDIPSASGTNSIAVDGTIDIAPGPDGALWFAEIRGDRIGRITTDGHIVEFSVPKPGCFPTSIAAGGDGAMWFVDDKCDVVGRVSSSGQFSEFPIPTSGSFSVGITKGLDGAMWFTEQNASKIGRVTVNGKFSELLIPTLNGSAIHPAAIRSGTDGSLWFTDEEGLIVRMPG